MILKAIKIKLIIAGVNHSMNEIEPLRVDSSTISDIIESKTQKAEIIRTTIIKTALRLILKFLSH